MIKTLVAAFAGALAVFVWGFLSWTVLHMEADSVHRFSDDEEVAKVLADNSDSPEPGYYIVPSMTDAEGEYVDEEVWAERMGSMAYATIMLHPAGMTADPAVMLPRGFAIYFVGALMVAWMVAKTGSRFFLGRLQVAVMMAIFAGAIGPLIAWNFMGAPQDWSIHLVMDTLIGWAIGGTVIAALMKPSGD